MKYLCIFCINEQNKKYFISHWKYAISWSRKIKTSRPIIENMRYVKACYVHVTLHV